MKLIFSASLVICLALACTTANPDYDYEEETAAVPVVPPIPAIVKQTTLAPVTPAKPSKLGSLLSVRSRGTGPLAARKSPATVSQTMVTVKSTTSTEQSVEQYDQYDETEEENMKQDISTTTSTEQPKKSGRGGVVRPFRSNEDLLAALKRRRAQGITPSHLRESSTSKIPAEITQSKSKSQSTISRSKASNINEVPKSTSRVRFGGTRGKNVTFNQEEAEETQSDNIQVKSKAYRRG